MKIKIRMLLKEPCGTEESYQKRENKWENLKCTDSMIFLKSGSLCMRKDDRVGNGLCWESMEH